MGARRGSPDERDLRAQALCGRQDAEGGARVRQSAQDLRRVSRGPLRHRGHRPGRESATRARRSDPGAAYAGATPAGADQENHRRSVQHRTRARGSRPASTPAQLVNETFTHSLGDTCETETFELRLYITGMTPRSTRAITAVRLLCEE